MATAESVKGKIQGLISLANGVTGKTDADLTRAIGSLIAGFGHGDGSGDGDASTLTKLIEGTVSVKLVDNQATIVRASAFRECYNLVSVDLPAATSIGSNAFYCCSKLTTVNIPAAISIETNALAASKLTTANFPAATSISNSAFSSCAKLTTVNFPAVTSIGGSAFQYCTKLTTVDFPAATSISNSAFGGCSALTTVDFPAATSISNRVFEYCSELTTIILRNIAEVATLSNTDAFNKTPITSGTGYIYVPSALVDSYKAATNWSAYANQIRALEDYTVDGTVTGELDPNKI